MGNGGFYQKECKIENLIDKRSGLADQAPHKELTRTSLPLGKAPMV